MYICIYFWFSYYIIICFWFFSYLSELIDVSSYGSEISVIHGTSGELLVKSTNSIINTFEQLRKYTKPCECFSLQIKRETCI